MARLEVLPVYSRHANWERVSSGLRHLHPVLERFVDTHIKSLHTRMLQSLNAQGFRCANNCSVRTLTPQHAYGPVCIHKNKRDCQCKVRNANPCPSSNNCGKIYDEIVREHVTNDPKWLNTEASRWASNHWEFAKSFISSHGYKNKNSASETDVSGLLAICLNCRTIRAMINPQQFEQVRGLRHDLMHAASLEMSSSDMQNMLHEMERLLQQQPFAGYQDAQVAARRIRMMPIVIHVPISKVEEFKDMRRNTLSVLKQIHRRMVKAGKLTKGVGILANGVTAVAGLVCLYLLFTAPPAAAPAAEMTLAVGRWVTLGVDGGKWMVDEYYSRKVNDCVQRDIRETEQLIRQLRQFERELSSNENQNVATLMRSIEIGLFTPSEALGFLNPKNVAFEVPKLKALCDNILKIVADTSVFELLNASLDKVVGHTNRSNIPNISTNVQRANPGSTPIPNPGPPLPSSGQVAGLSGTDNDMIGLLHVGKVVNPPQTEILDLQSGEFTEVLQGNYRTSLGGTPMYPNGLENIDGAAVADHAQNSVPISANSVVGSEQVPTPPSDVPPADKAPPKGPPGSDAALNGEQLFDAAMTAVTVAVSGYKVYRDCKALYNGTTSEVATKLADAIAQLESHIDQY